MRDVTEYLGEYYLFGTQLTHYGLQFRAANIIDKGTQVELRRGAIKNTNTEGMICFVFANRYTVSGLVVCQKVCVYECAIGIYFVQLSVRERISM